MNQEATGTTGVASTRWHPGEPIPLPAPAKEGAPFALRPFRAADFVRASELDRDASAHPWVEQLPETDAAAMERACERNRLEGALLQLVIADRRDDGYLGEIALVPLGPGTAELGCVVIDAARGRGIGTAALAHLATWAFAVLGLRRIQAEVDTRNPAALRMAEKAGFQREGVMRSRWEIGGELQDAVLLSLLPGEPVTIAGSA